MSSVSLWFKSLAHRIERLQAHRRERRQQAAEHAHRQREQQGHADHKLIDDHLEDDRLAGAALPGGDETCLFDALVERLAAIQAR